jgi:hypothetical protein
MPYYLQKQRGGEIFLTVSPEGDRDGSDRPVRDDDSRLIQINRNIISVRELKQIIEREEHIPIALQKLVLNHKTLHDETDLLQPLQADVPGAVPANSVIVPDGSVILLISSAKSNNAVEFDNDMSRRTEPRLSFIDANAQRDCNAACSAVCNEQTADCVLQTAECCEAMAVIAAALEANNNRSRGTKYRNSKTRKLRKQKSKKLRKQKSKKLRK